MQDIVSNTLPTELSQPLQTTNLRSSVKTILLWPSTVTYQSRTTHLKIIPFFFNEGRAYASIIDFFTFSFIHPFSFMCYLSSKTKQSKKTKKTNNNKTKYQKKSKQQQQQPPQLQEHPRNTYMYLVTLSFCFCLFVFVVDVVLFLLLILFYFICLFVFGNSRLRSPSVATNYKLKTLCFLLTIQAAVTLRAQGLLRTGTRPHGTASHIHGVAASLVRDPHKTGTAVSQTGHNALLLIPFNLEMLG